MGEQSSGAMASLDGRKRTIHGCKQPGMSVIVNGFSLGAAYKAKVARPYGTARDGGSTWGDWLGQTRLQVLRPYLLLQQLCKARCCGWFIRHRARTGPSSGRSPWRLHKSNSDGGCTYSCRRRLHVLVHHLKERPKDVFAYEEHWGQTTRHRFESAEDGTLLACSGTSTQASAYWLVEMCKSTRC